MTVKHLGKLTLDLVEKISQSEKNNQEQTKSGVNEAFNNTLKDKFLALIDQAPEFGSVMNDTSDKYSEYMSLATKAAIATQIEPLHLDHSSFKEIEQQRMQEINKRSAKISESFHREHERKEKLEQDRHDQLVSALERSNNQQALIDENAQLKAEIEKLKLENKQLKKIKGNLGTKESDNVIKIVTILADMAGLPKVNPSIAFNMMEAHAANNGLEIPSSNTVTKWLKE
ncbi:hypothetical protein [Acinetobacter pragensis]|uniref:Uncharacterized protein n=1 Tax=Acinetobacter pragensis TaxID=1806892 RepID=A0A151Y0P1_9GAMM|nr:hypothetical protein [Acinetobacter pragensis]KYQ71605.1 hypothetical protein AZH43_14025 [Acinetobacter pragensis]